MSFIEADWKYLQQVKPRLLSALCGQINREAERIVRAPAESEHAKYLQLFEHVQNSNDVVARCFDDWRRSRMFEIVLALHRHRLLSADELAQFSPQAQDAIRVIVEPPSA